MSMMNGLGRQDIDFNQIWETIAQQVYLLLTGMNTVSAMSLYEDVYKLCIAQPQPYCEPLYENIKKFFEQHVDRILLIILDTKSDTISEYLKQWKLFHTGCELCNKVIFRYLNNNWINKKIMDKKFGHPPDIYEIQTLGLMIWKERLFFKIKDRVLKCVEILIQKDRDGELVQHQFISQFMESLIKLDSVDKDRALYLNEYEFSYLENTKQFYSRESIAFISSSGVSSYMKKAEARIEEEHHRSQKYLNSTSHDKLRRLLDSILIEKHKELLQSECINYLKDEKLDEIHHMYKLLSRIEGGLAPVLETVQNYIQHVGFEAIKSIPDKNNPDPKVYVETLLKIYLQFSSIIKKSFNNDVSFITVLDLACHKIFNQNHITKNTTKSPELLAKYCDMLLKKGNKQHEEVELEEKLGQIIVLFKYVDDKDVFQKFYSKMLSRRLINASSVSDDIEKYMITGLKQACGFEYTSKFQRMFNDITISTETNEEFKNYLNNNNLSIVDFSILVLTSGSWSLHSQTSSFIVPQELTTCITTFQQYYQNQHQGRKLNWLHHLCKAEVKSSYLKKPFEFHVTNFQLGILLIFNTQDTVTLDEITKFTNLNENELSRTIQSLIEAKLLLAKKNPDSATQEYSLNGSYTNKRLKVKVSSSLQKETPTQTEETYKGIDEDRKLYLQASIVRIMKARKSMNHVSLIQEVIEHSRARFQPNIPMIKKCIEQLIEKEYITRAEGESDKYLYQS
ncbi:hypothetical protein DICPUDRAFT_57147 [Dictyostelium purpureum]|uniref:Cullin family profile domain-containing protein n=1 Tax=Dictyostelium purpureum TaxID=5786 RepID=F0ZUL0_DICPU|nr:uncharacterized protein DICPUDRAFT_57147 [Dictyostelium purpureum]EGC32378.1 hypothetical protein DICPUDRAFT_57147 [Dictyostelium purpureum]|eukprot:XP_003291108.1 hypothetical protein DICPUDRAFT_57147 [Dictyostelium purpureum]